MAKIVKQEKYKKIFSNNIYEEYNFRLYEDGDLEIDVYGPCIEDAFMYIPKHIVEKLKEMIK